MEAHGVCAVAHLVRSSPFQHARVAPIALDGDTVTLDASETWHGRYLLDSQLNLTKIPADDPLADPSGRTTQSSILAS
jgi:hypothetical protein